MLNPANLWNIGDDWLEEEDVIEYEDEDEETPYEPLDDPEDGAESGWEDEIEEF